jgi:hypothetical protein
MQQHKTNLKKNHYYIDIDYRYQYSNGLPILQKQSNHGKNIRNQSERNQ